MLIGVHSVLDWTSGRRGSGGESHEFRSVGGSFERFDDFSLSLCCSLSPFSLSQIFVDPFTSKLKSASDFQYRNSKLG